jgi:sugar lactone lactonase YvrE
MPARWICFLTTASILVTLAGRAASVRAQPPASCQTWMACSGDAVAAVQQKDFERFHDLAWRAVQLGPPRHPQLLYLLSRAQSLSGRPGDAIVTLGRLASMGVPTNARTEEHFQAARAHPRWPAVEALMVKAATPVESGDVAFRMTQRDLVPEALTYDEAGSRFLVGSLYKKKIVQVARVGHEVSDYAGGDAARFDGVLGLRIDRPRGILWVNSAATPQTEGYDEKSQQGRSHLHALDLRTGKVIASLAPAGAGPHLLNDLAISRRGDVYVTDSAAGVVHRVRAGTRTLELFVTIGEGFYPNGLALDASERVLYVASAAGISRVDLATREVSLVEPVADVALSGIDGLYMHRGTLVAVQNGLSGVARVVRFTLDPTGSRATAAQVLESNLPDFQFPTTGVLVGDDFYYIASAQLRSFEAPGRIWPMEKLREPTVRRIRLAREAAERP